MTKASQPARSLRSPQPDDVFQLRVSLMGINPPIWRRVLVPQDVTLPQLHVILQIVMGWTNSHLHQFKVGDVVFAEPHQEHEPGPIDYRRITLNQIAPRRGSTCVYEYDFGDSWDHLIAVADELPVETVSFPVPRCLEGERACPPEDCGGAYGYADLLRALRSPRHPEHDGSIEWLGPDFDPERFDLERVNDGLARFAPRPRGATQRGEHTAKKARRGR
ncbi:MAG: plasmid pRiA4b ORF-3 family protein [Chloroflexi bacterium]|nr:plasmid pRiA4b ORF-3 family protein [Chloroflexota bacterium]